MNQVVFLTALLSGIFLLVASFVVARFHWRADIPPYSLKTRSMDVLLHPAKYVQPQALRLTRILQLLGSLLSLVAILALARQFVHDFLH